MGKNKLDLSVEIAGVKFKNPILPGSAETAEDISTVRKMVASGVGGVVTKSFTSMKEATRRLRPYNFPLTSRKFGKGYFEAGGFLTYACPHPKDINIIIDEEIPQMAQECHQAGIPLVVSYFGQIEDINDWTYLGKRLEKAGANMLELQFSCPQAREPFDRNPQLGADILKAVSSKLNIPVGPKVSPNLEPIDKWAKSWEDAGASFLVAHNGLHGLVIDPEREEPFGGPVFGGYLTKTVLPYMLSRCVQMTKAMERIPVIGVSGIWSVNDVLQYMLAGSPAVQVCSAAYFKGFEVYGQIIKDLASWMERKNYHNVYDFIGKCLPLIISGEDLKTRADHLFSIPPDAPYEPLVSDQCNYCGRCQKVCYYGVYDVDRENKTTVIDGDKCWSCGWCVGICNQEAISLVDKTTKEVVWDGHGMAKPFKDIIKMIQNES